MRTASQIRYAAPIYFNASIIGAAYWLSSYINITHIACTAKYPTQTPNIVLLPLRQPCRVIALRDIMLPGPGVKELIKTYAAREFNADAVIILLYSSSPLCAPGVVTITFSGVMTSAPFAVTAPLNISETSFLNVSTISPSVMCSAVPLI